MHACVSGHNRFKSIYRSAFMLSFEPKHIVVAL